jgi:hypothetical protein
MQVSPSAGLSLDVVGEVVWPLRCRENKSRLEKVRNHYCGLGVVQSDGPLKCKLTIADSWILSGVLNWDEQL